MALSSPTASSAATELPTARPVKDVRKRWLPPDGETPRCVGGGVASPGDGIAAPVGLNGAARPSAAAAASVGDWMPAFGGVARPLRLEGEVASMTAAQQPSLICSSSFRKFAAGGLLFWPTRVAESMRSRRQAFAGAPSALWATATTIAAGGSHSAAEMALAMASATKTPAAGG